ncbi:MAG: PLP-dependent aminotransferase family protein [Synechococcales bacterium]|nr:PLP-dependent aminotransferase family protein [Synechococcales bacterium]
MTSSLPTTELTLYEQVADRLQQSIADGTLQPGDRLPSVRKLRQQMSVSMSTVLEAYRLLEDRGLIAARPQSGYYVKQTALEMPAEPHPSAPPRQVSAVDTSLAFRLMQTVSNPDLVQLGAALPGMDYLPLNALNRLMGQILRSDPVRAHAYSTVPGCEELRREIAKRMLDAGCSVSPDQVLTTNGTTEAVYLSLRAATCPGDTVAIESPCYYGLLETLKSLGLQALPLPTHPRDGISLEALEAALQTGNVTACLVVSNFSNPLGSCMGDRQKQTLVSLLNQYQVPLVEDDIYGELYFEGDRPRAIKAFDTEGWVLYCSSFSKTLSPGLRVGWAIAERYQRQMEQLKVVVNHMSAIAPQLTVAALLANGGYDRHLRQLRRAYQSQTGHMLRAICDYFPAETRVTQPRGGHVLWVEMPEIFDAIALYEEALSQGISIAPGPMFSVSGHCFRHCFRLNTGLPWSDEIDAAMQTIGYLAKRQLARKILETDRPGNIF